MNGVIGMIELAMDTELSSSQRDYLQTALNSANWLLGIINDLLDFSDIETGRLTLEEGDFHFTHVVHDVVGALVTRAEEKGLDLSLSVAPDVPETRSGADAARLRQVLVNLVGNAIKFHGTRIRGGARQRRRALRHRRVAAFRRDQSVDLDGGDAAEAERAGPGKR